MTIHNGFATCTSTREIEAALDEIGGPGAKAPKKIPVGITMPKPGRVYRGYRRQALHAARSFGDFDFSTARSVRSQIEMQVYAESTYVSKNLEDEIIDRLDRERGERSLGQLLCTIADRAPRRTVHHS